MIPRFIHEQLIDNCDILVEKFKEFEKIIEDIEKLTQ